MAAIEAVGGRHRTGDVARLPRLLLRIAGALLAAGLLAVVAVLVVVPLITHAVARTVESGSMSPALPIGSVVLDRPVDPNTLAVGDIATYREARPGGDVYVTHRIVAIDATRTPISFTFRGDANRTADPVAVPARDVVGRVWFDVPYLGTLRTRIAELRPLLVGVGVLALGAYSAVQLAGGRRERRAGR